MNKRMLSKLLVAVLCLSTAAISPLSAATTTATKYEAEEAVLHNVTLGDNSFKGYSGTGYVGAMDASDAYIEFTVEVPTAGRYNLGINFCAPYGQKMETITVNGGQSFNVEFKPSEEFAELNAGVIKLNAGENKIRISRFWGWTLFDYITISPADKLEINTNVSDKLIDSKATAETQKLMTYLTSIYGKNILSGQFAYTTRYTELAAIYKETGKYPAIIGLDFSDYSPARVALGCNKGQDTEKAIEYWKQGGLSTFCWHWASPIGGSTDPDKKWGSFYTENTTFDLSVAMADHDSDEYKGLIRDIDVIAEELKKLQDAGVPILWRPLHEAAGGWFWWGAKGPEPYKELYKLMYDRLTNYHGIHNLIWVWNGADKDWYPGDEYVDIIGEDIYAAKHDYDSQANGFVKAMGFTSANKMITMSENGVLMDPDVLVGDGVPWLWNCTWGGEFVVPWVGSSEYTEAYTSKEMLKKYYDHEYVLTRDELPSYLFDKTTEAQKVVKVEVSTSAGENIVDCTEEYVPITLSAKVESEQLYSVEYFVNGVSVGKGETVTWLPAGKTTNADGIETYKVVAKVTTEDGKETASKVVNVKVKLPVKEAMKVEFTNEFADVIDATEGATVTLSAKAENAESDCTVEYFVNGKSIGKGESADWIINEETTNADGLKTYTVKAVATNANGEKAEVEKEVTVKLPVKQVSAALEVSEIKGSPVASSINLSVEVKNNGEAVDLNKLEMRYYFTEANAPAQTLYVDHSAAQFNTAPWYVALTSAVKSEIVNLGNGEYCLSIKFNDKTAITQGTKLILQGRLAKADWSNYDQSDDFSYENGIAVYYDGALVAGMEP